MASNLSTSPATVSPTRATVSRFTIPDMECGGCAAKVERAIDQVDGVDSVTVSLVARRVAVQHDASISRRAITTAIRDAGYSPEDAGSNSFWRQHATLRRDRVFTALSGILFAAGLVLGATDPADRHQFLWQGMPDLAAWTLLAAAAVGGLNFFGKGLRALRQLSLDMDFLMTIAIIGAAAIGEFTEAAAIAFLFSTAEMLEDFAVDRARNSLVALMDLAPDEAAVRRDGRELIVSAEEVVVGDVVLVRPGNRVAVDAEVVEGSSHVDQSAITGESMPALKRSGDEVFAGSINGEGYLEARALRAASDSTLSRIIHMVEEAEEHKAPSEQFVRRFARVYTPVITVAAVLVVLVPPLLFGADFVDWFVRGLTLLVIACPCALVISTPVAVVSSITSAARNGVLLKGGNYLETLGSVRAVAFDKTGTLTEGRLQVTDVHTFNGHSQDQVLHIAASLERRAHHPIARAILERADWRGW